MRGKTVLRGSLGFVAEGEFNLLAALLTAIAVAAVALMIGLVTGSGRKS
jgi:hypothetical protein